MRLREKAILTITMVGVACSLAIAAQANLDDLLKQVAAYDYGKSRAALTATEDLIKASHKDAAQRKQIVAKLIAFLDSKATVAAKRFVCRQLSIIAGPEAVPAAAKLLPDPQLSHMARMILERVPGEQAAAALRDALPKLKGKLLIGVVNSLGVRRDTKAASAIARLLANPDPAVASAAATALGKIGGPEATAALKKALATAPKEAHLAVVNAYLRCADHLVAAGKPTAAKAIYRQVWDSKEPDFLRVAALRGMVAAGGDDAVALVTKALTGPDPTLRAIATSFIRDMKADVAIKTFGPLLPKLPPATQALVVAALADKRDPAARPIILKAAKSSDATVRAAAIDALAVLGTPDDVPMLASVAAKGPGAEKGAAERALCRMTAKGTDQAIMKCMATGDPTLKATMTRCLAARRCKSAVPTLLKAAADPDQRVRIEALKALGALGDQGILPQLTQLLVAAKSSGERSAAEKAIQSIASRVKDPNARTAPLISALPNASVEAKRSLLALLGRLGGPKALAAVRAALKDPNPQVKDGAIRALANWPDATVLAELLDLAKNAPQPVQRIIALRGYVRLLGLPNKRKPEESLKLYQEAMNAATRPDEKKLILAGLGQVHHIGALKLAESCIADPALKEEASLATYNIARAIGRRHKAEAKAALQKVLATTRNKRLRRDAGRLLGQLK